MEEYSAVAWETLLINEAIPGNMNYLARCINFNVIWATSARILLGLASPYSHVLLRLKGNHLVQIIVNATTTGSKSWLDSTLKWA